ncbi:hypothetical protein M3Y97_01021200 [Aphelenchoides bicaudatus]|nr:hypothetical protein M3Y97_01021200 [Aphelenchoides bicaudatus]
MFLVAAVFDLFFSGLEILTQNQVAVNDGVVIVLCHGLERYIPQWFTIYVVLPLHTGTLMHGVMILPVLYRFRYLIISRPQTSFMSLVKSLVLSIIGSLMVGAACGMAASQSLERPRDVYMNRYSKGWREENEAYFEYAGEKEDSGTLLAAYLTFCFTVASIFFIFYYFILAYKFINRSTVTTRSQRTRSLQNQFTWILVAQTVIAFVFSLFPLILITTCLLMRIQVESVGIGIMTPLSFLPAANALLTLLVIKNYRQFLREFTCRDKSSRVISWTNSRSNTPYQQQSPQVGGAGGAAGSMLAVGLQMSRRVLG